MLKQAKKAKQMCAKLHVNFIPSAKNTQKQMQIMKIIGKSML